MSAKCIHSGVSYHSSFCHCEPFLAPYRGDDAGSHFPLDMRLLRLLSQRYPPYILQWIHDDSAAFHHLSCRFILPADGRGDREHSPPPRRDCGIPFRPNLLRTTAFQRRSARRGASRSWSIRSASSKKQGGYCHPFRFVRAYAQAWLSGIIRRTIPSGCRVHRQ